MRKSALILILCLTILGSTYLGFKVWRTSQLQGPEAPETQLISEWLEESLPPSELESKAELEPESSPLPQALNLELPFYTQAPFSNWDYPWQEACEEASSALVANLYLNKNWTRDEFNTELLRLVDWEMQTFGAYEHTSAAQTAELIEKNYGLKAQIHEYPTYDDLQTALAKGHFIIAPFAGKLLENPNFKNGGPNYHMLVIKGYDASKNQVVTNDVGTRNGADYVYNWSTISNALHDWNSDDITQGIPRWIEVSP